MEIDEQKKQYFLFSFVMLIASVSVTCGEEADQKEQGFIKGKLTSFDMCILLLLSVLHDWYDYPIAQRSVRHLRQQVRWPVLLVDMVLVVICQFMFFCGYTSPFTLHDLNTSISVPFQNAFTYSLN